jgi:hypothetical protein
VEGESLHYTVTITNDKNYNDTIWFFQLLKEEFYVASYAKDRFALTPGANVTFDVFIAPTDDTPLLIELPFTFYFSNPANENAQIVFKGKFLKASDLRPVIASYSFPGSFDPRQTQELILEVYNPTGTFMEPLVRYEILKNDVLVMNDSLTILLEPLTLVKVSFNVNMDDRQQTGDYALRFRAYNKDYAYAWNTTVFTILGYAEYPAPEPVIEKPLLGLLGKTVKLNITNTGTGQGTISVPMSVTPIDRFLSYDKKGNVTFTGDKAIFTATIPAGGTAEFVYRVTYAPLILLPIILLSLYYAYTYATRKIRVSRKVVPLHIGEHSTSFKVTIRVKNLSKQKLKSVRVREVMLPFIKKIGSYGTLHPKIIKDLTGTKLFWTIDEMSPRSEVIITYQFHTSLGILGKIFLPGTKVNYKHKGKEGSARGGVSVFSTGKH